MVEEVEVEREKNMDAPEPVAGGLSDTEAQVVIQAIEPILKNSTKKR